MPYNPTFPSTGDTQYRDGDTTNSPRPHNRTPKSPRPHNRTPKSPRPHNRSPQF